MNKVNTKNRVLTLMITIILVVGAMSSVFADGANPSINFSSSGVTYNEETNLLRFNLKWTHPDNDSITVKYNIDGGKTKKLGEYQNQSDQVIAHIYLEGEDVGGSHLTLYAVDSKGNRSEEISSEFQVGAAQGVTIKDEAVPLSSGEGTWALINLFLAALSVAMVAVSVMLFVENKKSNDFKSMGKIKSAVIVTLTIIGSGANILILLLTQNLKHQMVMYDNMTITMLVITILCIFTTMVLANRAYTAQESKYAVREDAVG